MGEGYWLGVKSVPQKLPNKIIIGASVSEPLSSDLNVNFVCLSVCLSVCHGGTVNLLQITSGSYFARFASCIDSKTTWELNSWTMDSLTPQQWQQWQRPLTDLPIQWLERYTQPHGNLSIPFCLWWLTHGVCVSHWSPTSHNSVMEITRVLSSVYAIHELQCVLEQPVCSMLFFPIIILHYSKDTSTSINANTGYAPNTDTV